MKKLLLISLAFLFIPFILQAQGTGMEVRHAGASITTALDSSTAKDIWYSFKGSGGYDGFRTTTAIPNQVVKNTSALQIYGTITKTSGTEASDSLEIYAVRIGHDGYVIGTDTLYFDWTNNVITTTRPTGAARVKDWTIFSGTAGVTAYTFDMNMTNSYGPCLALKFNFALHDGDDSGSGTGVYELKLTALEVW